MLGKNLASVYVAARLENNKPVFRRIGIGQCFTNTFTEGGMATDKYGNIGAQPQADLCEFIGAQLESPEMVESQQGGCGVGAPAAKTAAHG